MVHSDRLPREREVRDEILTYYGFKINYLEKGNNFKKLPDDIED